MDAGMVRITQLIRDATGGNKPPRGALTRWAEAIPTSVSTVSRWRDGTIPDPEWWPGLADALQLSIDEVEAACAQSTIEPTNADLLVKLEEILELLRKPGDRIRVRHGGGSDGTPSSMPRPALKARARRP